MTVTTIPLSLANGQQVVPVFGAGQIGGAQQVIISADVDPSAGTVQLEYRLAGSDVWQLAPHAVQPANTLPVFYSVYGSVAAYRVTKAGIVGGVGLSLWLADVQPGGFPDGAFTGLRALTTQPYTEANVKNGLQYYLRAVWPTADPIANGTPRKIWFRTTSKPVIVKLRDFQYVGEEIQIDLFRGPTGVAGGTPLTINNYNGVNPIASTCQATKNVTTVSDGTPFGGGDSEYFFGSASNPNRTQESIPQGRERVLPANTEFLVRVQNNISGGANTARAQYYLDWYEGATDLPLNP